jgi:hypothetical protein
MKLKEVDIPCLVKVQMTIIPKSVAKGLKTKVDMDDLLDSEVGEYYQEVLITRSDEVNERQPELENKIDVNLNGKNAIKVMKYEPNCDFYYIPYRNRETGEKKYRILRIKKIIMRIPGISNDLCELFLERMDSIKKECDRINIKYQDKNHKQICMEIMGHYNRMMYDRIKLIKEIYEKENPETEGVELEEMMDMESMSYTDMDGDEVEIYRNLLDEIFK